MTNHSLRHARTKTTKPRLSPSRDHESEPGEPAEPNSAHDLGQRIKQKRAALADDAEALKLQLSSSIVSRRATIGHGEPVS